MKCHRQCNVSSSHSQDVITKIIDTLWAQIVKLLLTKVVRESFSSVSNNM